MKQMGKWSQGKLNEKAIEEDETGKKKIHPNEEKVQQKERKWKRNEENRA